MTRKKKPEASLPAPESTAVPPLNPMLKEFKLEQFLEVMGTQHQLKAARRLGTNRKVSSKLEAERQIRLTLSEPRNVDDLVARLHPTELALLQEARRYGGVVNGWTLYVYARLRGLNPPTQSMSTSSNYLFRDYQPASYTGASLIWSLLADGLLFPVKVPNPWISDSGYSYYKAQWELFPGAPGHLLVADPRLLTRLPLAPRPPAPALPSEPASTPAPGLGVLMRVRLSLAEVLRVVDHLGGLALTKNGEPSKASLKRILKDLENLKDPGMWLGIVMQLGLLIPDRSGERLVPYRAGRQELNRLPPREFAGLLLNILPRLDTAEDARYRLTNPYTLRACLLELLRELRGPVRERALKKQAEQVIPSELRTSRTYDYYGRQGKQEVGKWDAWFAATLRGVLVDFGLLSVQEDPAQGDALLIPSPVLRGEFGTVASEAGPAWVLQPNFELLVYPAHLQPEHFALLSAAEAVRIDEQTATYRLTRDSVYTALESGLEVSDLLSGLEAGSATPLAPAMRRTVQDWAARRERLVLHQHATLLEYPTPAERDTALNKGKGGVAVGDTFLLLDAGRTPPVGTSILKYDAPPSKPLIFKDSGEFAPDGPLDLTGRTLLAGRVTANPEGLYRFVPPGDGQVYPRNLIPDLEARSRKRLPDPLRFQLSVWSGLTPSPAVANLTIVQHPQAQMLSKHPTLHPLLGPELSATLLTVQAGKEAAFLRAMSELGLTPKQEMTLEKKTTEELVVLTDTRKKRAFIEEVIQNGHNLLLHYYEEKEVHSGWYGTRITQGKLRKEILRPEKIDRSGSTPYLRAQVLASGEHVRIRIAYVTGMAIR